jgi:hypothetical protein
MQKQPKRNGSFLTLVVFLFLLGAVFWCVRKFSSGPDTIARVEHRQNPVDLTFDINEFNSLGGAINTATGKLLAVHFGLNNVKRK